MGFLTFVAAGLAGGILAGLGMGGGTLTLPILVLALGVGQLTAQYANLLAFLPSGAAALAVHAKNGFLNVKSALPIMIPAMLSAGACSYFAAGVSGELLKKLFGGFLIAVAALSLFTKTVKKS